MGSQYLPLYEKLRQQLADRGIEEHSYLRTSIEELQSRLKSGDRTPSLYTELAELYMSSAQTETAARIVTEGLAACEPDKELYGRAIFALGEANRTEEAICLTARARELFPDAQEFELSEALMLPVLYDTEKEADDYRARFSDGLRAVRDGLRLDTPEDRRLALAGVSRYLNFYLGYQGRNDRQLQEEYGQYVHRIVAANYPEWVKPRPMPPVEPGGRIRVGYISAHFRNHSVSKLFCGWLYERNRQDFESFVYHNGQTADPVTEKVREASDHFRHVPGEFEGLCRAILADNLHIAVFLDVRHRRMAMVSALRLAPVQCVAWAHPITSGAPMIDYYLSNERMEPEGGEDHYSERLVRLPGIGVYYPKPVIPRPLLGKTRADFGLGQDRIVFACCQSSFKYLPQHDDLFVRIAKKVPSAQFVFLALNDAIGKVFLARLERAFGAQGLRAADHCVILPQLSKIAYWNLHVVSDVFLDTLGWSGGVTALEAIACGLPIVTLPGPLMRSRHSYGILQQLGVTDTIASDKDEYVDIAVRLALNSEWRAEIRKRMAEEETRLYWDTSAVRGLEEFFHSVCRTSAPGETG